MGKTLETTEWPFLRKLPRVQVCEMWVYATYHRFGTEVYLDRVHLSSGIFWVMPRRYKQLMWLGDLLLKPHTTWYFPMKGILSFVPWQSSTYIYLSALSLKCDPHQHGTILRVIRSNRILSRTKRDYYELHDDWGKTEADFRLTKTGSVDDNFRASKLSLRI